MAGLEILSGQCKNFASAAYNRIASKAYQGTLKDYDLNLIASIYTINKVDKKIMADQLVPIKELDAIANIASNQTFYKEVFNAIQDDQYRLEEKEMIAKFINLSLEYCQCIQHKTARAVIRIAKAHPLCKEFFEKDFVNYHLSPKFSKMDVDFFKDLEELRKPD